jgi:hypothetical protein
MKPKVKKIKGVDVKLYISPKSPHKKGSFWFCGCGDVACVNIKGRAFFVEATGEIRVMFKPNGETFKNEMAVKEAERLNLTDKKLNKLSNHDGWLNNNWFDFYEEMKDGTPNYFDIVAYDYDEAIKTLVDIVLEETK